MQTTKSIMSKSAKTLQTLDLTWSVDASKYMSIQIHPEADIHIFTVSLLPFENACTSPTFVSLALLPTLHHLSFTAASFYRDFPQFLDLRGSNSNLETIHIHLHLNMLLLIPITDWAAVWWHGLDTALCNKGFRNLFSRHKTPGYAYRALLHHTSI